MTIFLEYYNITPTWYTVRVMEFYKSSTYKAPHIERVSLPCGYMDSKGQPHYYIPDYQGNIRVVADASGNIEQATDYYPYGMPMATSTGAEVNRYKYSGKELETRNGLNFYDFEARLQFPTINFMNQPDVNAADYNWLNPYLYCAANPIANIDPTGKDWVCNFANGSYLWEWSDDISDINEAIENGYCDYRPCGSIVDNARINGGRYGSVYLGFSSRDVYYTTSNKVISPWGLGWEWLSGTGPRKRYFIDGDNFTELLRMHDYYKEVLMRAKLKILSGEYEGHDKYSLSGLQGIGKYIKDYSTLLTAGKTGNLAVTFLGSHEISWEAKRFGDVAIVTITVTNSSTMGSASRPPVIGYYDWWQTSIGNAINNAFSSGFCSETKQTITFREIIDL